VRIGRQPGLLPWLTWEILASLFLASLTFAAEPDPNIRAVQVVCGRCHTTAVFMNKPRSWERWNDVFADMTKRGANGSDEQLAQVTSYFLENLTLVNVNSSPADNSRECSASAMKSRWTLWPGVSGSRLQALRSCVRSPE